MSATSRIGILGGSFDPIHIGHLVMAENARDQLTLDLVLFVPAGRPPHKPDQPLAPIEDRIAMIELAIVGRAEFVCSRIDADIGEPSFTWKLLERVHGEYPGAEFSFIIGGDSLREFGSWARPQRILELASIAVVDRPGHDLDNAATGTVPGLDEAISLVDTPMCAVSSTEIRERVRVKQSIRYLVPEAVWEYIERSGLYR